MGLAIFLRKRQAINKFRELLISSIDTGLGDEAIICSGFFQEHFKGGIYQVSNEGNLDNVLLRNKINLTTVGVHNNNWLTPYRNFRDNLRNIGLNVNAKTSRGFHWHAKIYVLISKGRPIFAIIGSSNMTRNAFGISAPFNFESDVVLWLDEFNEFNTILNVAVSELNQFSSEVIIADYDPDKNFGLSIEDRLRQLVDDIKKTELNDLK